LILLFLILILLWGHSVFMLQLYIKPSLSNSLPTNNWNNCISLTFLLLILVLSQSHVIYNTCILKIITYKIYSTSILLNGDSINPKANWHMVLIIRWSCILKCVTYYFWLLIAKELDSWKSILLEYHQWLFSCVTNFQR
jgi:hypothetical protein